jgi:hypothetical protein
MEAIVGVAALLGEEQHCLKALKNANATSPEKAVKLEEAEISGIPLERAERALQRLVKRGKVKTTADGHYYVECKDGKHC